MRPDISLKSVFIFVCSFLVFSRFLLLLVKNQKNREKTKKNEKTKKQKNTKNQRLGDYMRPDISLKSFFVCFFFVFSRFFFGGVFDQK